jgi:enediyne polyketide synthase
MALAAGGQIEVAIRAGDDSFASDRMSATFAFDAADTAERAEAFVIEPTLEFDASALYGTFFFQGERYRCIRSFSHLTARRVAAELFLRDATPCFSQFEQQQLVLGDPNTRDSLLHALQAAAPHRRVIPVSVAKIHLHPGKPPVRMEAVEREATDESFSFDIIARDEDGAIVEYWHDVLFRAISGIKDLGEVLAATPALIPPYLERVARAALDDASIEVALICDRLMPREERRARALKALGLHGRVFSRSDGRPILVGYDPQHNVSIAHRDAVALAVRAAGKIGCDVERVTDWSEADALSPLTAPAAALATELASDVELPAVAAARIWSLREATAKHAQQIERSWKARRSIDERIVLFETASGKTATIHVPGPDGGIVVAIARSTASPLVAATNAPDQHERIA